MILCSQLTGRIFSARTKARTKERTKERQGCIFEMRVGMLGVLLVRGCLCLDVTGV